MRLARAHGRTFFKTISVGRQGRAELFFIYGSAAEAKRIKKVWPKHISKKSGRFFFTCFYTTSVRFPDNQKDTDTDRPKNQKS